MVESKLKVMLEQDYLSLEKHEGIQSKQAQAKDTNQLGSQIVREIVIPELTKEVNENKNFARLRQVYNSLILATWYKKKIKDSILTKCMRIRTRWPVLILMTRRKKRRSISDILRPLKKAFITISKKNIDPVTQETIPRKYFSGGVQLLLPGFEETTTHLTGDLGVTNDPNVVKPVVPGSEIVVEALTQQLKFDFAMVNSSSWEVEKFSATSQEEQEMVEHAKNLFINEFLRGRPENEVEEVLSKIAKHPVHLDDLSHTISFTFLDQGDNKDVFKVVFHEKNGETINIKLAMKNARKEGDISEGETDKLKAISGITNAVPTFGIRLYTPESSFYLEEFIEGQTIRSFKEQNLLTVDVRRKAVRAVLEVAKVLDSLGEKDPVPQDIHDKNIILGEGTRGAVLVDLGTNFGTLEKCLLRLVKFYGYFGSNMGSNKFIFGAFLSAFGYQRGMELLNANFNHLKSVFAFDIGRGKQSDETPGWKKKQREERKEEPLMRQDAQNVFWELKAFIREVETNKKSYLRPEAKPEVNSAMALTNDADAPQSFVNNVFLPVIGQDLPPNVHFQYGQDGDQPWIAFDHIETEPLSGTQVHFRYKVKLTDNRYVRVPDFVLLEEENVLEIPKPSVETWNDDFVQTMRYGLRRLMIADPLNGRFTGKYELDPYQKEAKTKIAAAFEKGHKALAVMATATGKTVVGFESMNDYLDKVKGSGAKAGAVLFIVNNNTILREAEEKLIGSIITKGSFKGLSNIEQKFNWLMENGYLIKASPTEGRPSAITEAQKDRVKAEFPEEALQILTILQKSRGMYPGKYTTSKIYEGEADYSGDVIFATPSSLGFSGRLEELLNQKKVSMVVFDEVHHLPAENIRNVYRRIEEESIRKKSDTKFLGLTATEIRPDRVSVISLFERNIVFEYPIFRGQQEGALVPLSIVNADHGYPTEAGNMEPILPGDPRWDLFRNWRYSEKRYPDLLGAYQQNTANLLDKRALILAPTIEDAQRLAAFFRHPKDKDGNELPGVAAVSLTGDDRTRDPKAFEDNYQAWRKGRWPDGSTRPIPQVVIAVDIFKEGIDVPAINLVMLWADTNSTIEFMQSLGRGLRLAPFKTKLIVVDAIGLMRKLHLLKILGGALGSGKSVREDGLPGLPQPGKHVVVGGTLQVSRDITAIFENYLDAIPDKLALRYETYSNIPVNQLLEVLDPWLARHTEFVSPNAMNGQLTEGVEAFYRYMTEFAEKLYQGTASSDDKLEFRHKFMYPFHASIVNETTASNEEVYNMPIESEELATRIVYYRILELLNHGRGEQQQLSADRLDDIFPEFSEKERNKLKNRTNNLRQLRQMVFNTDFIGLAKEFYDQIIRNEQVNFRTREHREADRTKFHETWRLAQRIGDAFQPGVQKEETEVHRSDIISDLQEAEGSYRTRRSGQSAIEGNLLSDRSSSDPTFIKFVQESVIRLSLYHPRLTGLLFEDFELSPVQFREKLDALALTSNLLSPTEVLNILERYSQEYSGAVESANPALRDRARDILLVNLTNEAYQDYFQQDNITGPVAQRLVASYTLINSALEKLGQSADEKDRKMHDAMQEILKKIGALWESPIEGMPGVKLSIRSFEHAGQDFWVTVTSDNPNFPVPEEQPLQLFVRKDLLGFKYLMLSDASISAIERFYQARGDVERNTFLNGFLSLIDQFNIICGGELTLMLPQDSQGHTFFSDLFEHVLAVTDYDVMGPLIHVRPTDQFGDFNFTLRGLSRSRLSRLTPEYISRMINKRTYNEYTFPSKIRYIMRTLYNFHNNVLPVWENIIQPKLTSVQLTDPLYDQARNRLLNALTNQINKDVTGPERMWVLQRVFWMLGQNGSDKVLTPDQILRAYLFCMTRFSRFFFGHIESFKAARKFTDSMAEFYGLATQQNLNIDPDLEANINKAVKELVAFIHQSTYLQEKDSYQIGELPDEQISTLDQLSETIGVELKKIHNQLSDERRAANNTLDLPPYIVTRNDRSGEEKTYLAFWLEDRGKPNPKTRKNLPLLHWSKKHVDEVLSQKPNAKITFTDSGKDLSDYNLCPNCPGRPGIIVQGTPNYHTWPSIIRDVERGIIRGIPVNSNGELGPETKPAEPSERPPAIPTAPQRQEAPGDGKQAPFFGKSDHSDSRPASWKLAFAVFKEKKKEGDRYIFNFKIDWNVPRGRQLWGDQTQILFAEDLYDYQAGKPKRPFTVVGEGTPSDPREWLKIQNERRKNERYVRGHDLNEQNEPIVNSAELVKGGIDLTPANMNLQTQNKGGEIKFHLDAAMLQQLQNAPGFVPVIIDFQPMTDLKKFLGINV